MKQKCTPRERVLKAFAHEEPDRVPVDLGSTANTSITKDAYENLKRFLKVDAPSVLMSKNLSTSVVDDAVLERFNVDTRGVFLSGSDKWRDIELAPDKYIDEWGVTYYRPPGFPFYDALVNPLAGNITAKTLKEYPWPNPHNAGRVRNIRERFRYLRDHTDYAVVLHIMGGFITNSQYLRGLGQWLEDLAAEPELTGDLLDCTLKYQMDLTMDALSECDFDPDIVHFGDDLGMQSCLMFSPETYREIIKPRQAKLFRQVKSNTRAKILYHSCGCNYDILDDLIEIGMDALNPVQTNAKNMQAEKLKKEFGDRLTFWGAIDTHSPHIGSDPSGMENEVRNVINALAPGGGFILNPIHNIQPDITPENIVALFDSAARYGSY